jgi:hypothetical protein
MMKTGVLLIATGHKNYFRMAEVLAASIRVNDPSIKICIATDGKHLVDMSLFDQFVQIDEKYLTEPIKAKVFMNKITPFEETLFLDVDQVMIWKRSLQSIFEECKNLDWTMSNSGKAGGSVWANLQEVLDLYGPGDMWNFHSELFYFKNTLATRTFFGAAQKAYKDNKVKSATVFAGGHMADELAFQIASMQTNQFPHKENWCPNFWFDAHPKQSRAWTYQLKDYVTYSIGGKLIPEWVKAQYNTLAKAYFATLHLSHPYQVVDKRNFLPERRTI